MDICKDIDFPGRVRLNAAKGVSLMGVPAGDMGIDASQHGIMAVVRESRTSILQNGSPLSNL